MIIYPKAKALFLFMKAPLDSFRQATGLGRSTMAVAALCLIVEYSWSCAAVSVDWSGKLLRADFGFLSQAPPRLQNTDIYDQCYWHCVAKV